MGERAAVRRGGMQQGSARAVGNPVCNSYLQESPEDTGDDTGSVLYNRGMAPFEIFK